MKTITFYSYKGGVGRTLSLVNVANLLEEFGKKVCIIDFDLEAPGVELKYKNYIQDEIKVGLVDYIHEFAIDNRVPDSIKDYCVTINHIEKNKTLIPAGNTRQSEYWRKLSRINWWNLFYQEHSEGIPFFLDLKAKIKKEINPDYLLIDTRTGITEMSAITMSLLADSIVLLAANNDENICGIEQVIRSISRKENNLLQPQKKIHFVLTRIPFPQTPEEVSIESEIQNLIREKIENAFNDQIEQFESFNIIHSDRETEISGKASMCYRFNRKDIKIKPSIIPEYLSLFESLIQKDLDKSEQEKLEIFIYAKELLNAVYNNFESNSPHLSKELDHIDKLIPRSPDSYFLRGYYHYMHKEYVKAEAKFKKGIREDESGRCLFFYAESLFKQKKHTEARKSLESYLDKRHSEYRANAYRDLIITKSHMGENREKLIEEANAVIGKYPYYSSFYNIRSCLFLKTNEYELALKDAYKAIELEPISLYYVTLAEIKLSQGNMLEFYREMDTALKLGYEIEEILSEEELAALIYKAAANDSEFERMLNRHMKTYFLDLLREKFKEIE